MAKDIDFMTAGPQMDALMVTDVLHQRLYRHDLPGDYDAWEERADKGERVFFQDDAGTIWASSVEDRFNAWSPSNKIAAAWEVVQKLESLGWELSLSKRSGIFYCSFGRPEWVMNNWYAAGTLPLSQSDTAMLAICRAAYKVVNAPSA